MARGRKVYGLVPQDSTSIAYTANPYDPQEDLLQVIEQTDLLPVHALDVTINYLDGTKRKIDVYSTLSINRDSGQAAMMDLTGRFNGAAQTVRVIGEGIAFSTPLGSTGQGYSNGGAIIGPALPAIIFTGIGLGRPRGMNPIVATGADSFSVQCIVSQGKRPLRIDYDGNSIRPVTDNPAVCVDIALNQTPGAMLVVRTGAFHPFKRLELP